MTISELASVVGITKEQLLEVLAMALQYRLDSMHGDVYANGVNMGILFTLATLSGLPVHEFMQAVFDSEVMLYRQEHPRLNRLQVRSTDDNQV